MYHTQASPKVRHASLETTFCGKEHPTSTSDVAIHQYLGIKYASIPARFRQSKLFTSHSPIVDASHHGPICPQLKNLRLPEENLFGVAEDLIPKQNLQHDEFECLNLNITCPAGLTPRSHLPVMMWFHGGGNIGSGSSWIYDGGALVRKSMEDGKPMILVTFNFRIGLLGFAASPIIRDDNKAAGEVGTGNYGLRDQARALEWLHHYIVDFGGDPNNITLFGESSGAADIICHLLSSANEVRPMFHRAIVQSAVFEPTLPDVANAGWHLSRVMSALQVSDIDELRTLDVEKLLGLGHSMRSIDDGVFFRKGWQSFFSHHDDQSQKKQHRQQAPTLRTPARTRAHSSRSRSVLRPSLHSRSRSRTPKMQTSYALQPLIIGDSSCDSLLWSLPISQWTSSGVARRTKAICQSLSKSSNVLRAYDISAYTPDDEIVDRVLELVNDARIAWPTECIVENARQERGGHGVWRYVFDQEGPSRGIPHHAADLVYLFGNVPLPASCLPSEGSADVYFDGSFDDVLSDDEECCPVTYREDDEWMTAVVDEYSYARVRDELQERWISFAYGEAPWREDKVFVFGPEGETGERSHGIFDGRRRRQVWKETFEPLGAHLVQKLGVELSRGPALSG